MKKYLLLFTSAALLLVGCAKEQIVDLQEGELTNVTFTANVDNGATTKALADNDGKGASVNRCIMEIYYGDTFYKRLVQPVANKVATFANVPVVAGKQYTVLFWADCGNENKTDKYYTTNGPDSLKAVTVNMTEFINALTTGKNDELDAFYLGDKYTITQGGVSKDVTLKRPFAQLNVITTDVAANKAVISEGLLPDAVKVSYTAYNTFNVADSTASGSETYSYEAPVYGKYEDSWEDVKDRGELTLSMDYVLAAVDKGAIDVEFKVKNGGADVLTHNLTNLPYQRNYRTNVKGDLLTIGGTWKATIDADWTTPNYDVPVYVASSIADAQSYIAPTESGTARNKVVDLSNVVPTTDDLEEDGSIKFELKTTSPADMVNFTLPEIPQNVLEAGCTGWKITHQPGYPTQNVNVIAPDGTSVIIDAPSSHVTLNGAEYEQVTASTSYSTLVVPAGVTVDKLIVKEGAVEIHGTVSTLEVAPTEGAKVCFRECEGLSTTVYDVLKDYIAPNYKAVQNDNSWDIVPEDFWPNFAAAEFSAIDQSAKTLSISTPAELALLAKNINGGTSYAGYTISINGSLDMGAHFWIPINARNGQLSGSTVEGTGNAVISNLKIEKAVYSGNYDYYAGFIAQSVGALTVKDLTFSGAVSVDNGSGVATVLGLTYGNTLFENVKVLNSTVSAATKAGALVGFTGGNNATVTVRDCALKNVTVKAEYSYALMVGLVNTSDHVVFEGNNTAVNSHAVLDEEIAATDMPERKNIKGYEYGVDGTKLWVIGVQDAWAECRTNPTPTKTIDDVEYSVMGDKFYHADSVVVDVCAPDPVAQIGDTKYATLDAAFAAAQEGQTVEIIQAGTYTLPSPISNLTIKGIEGVEFNAMKEYGQSVSQLHDVKFESVKFIFGSSHYTGFQHSESVTFTKCTFEGYFNSYGTMLFDQCTFNSPESNYSMWCYAGDVTYRNCTINCKGKFVNVYNEGNTTADRPWKVVAEGCTFNSSVKNKSAFNIKATCGEKPLYYDVVIKNCTANGENWPAASTSESLVVGSALWQVDDIKASVASKIKVTVDDTVVYTSPEN